LTDHDQRHIDPQVQAKARRGQDAVLVRIPQVVKQGKLVTTERCRRCGEERTRAT
jgi:hypothetical protein